MLGADEVAALDDNALLDALIAHKPVANDSEQNVGYRLVLESALIHRFGYDYYKRVHKGAPADAAATAATTEEPPAFSSWSGSFAKLDGPDRRRVAALVDKGKAIIGSRGQIEQRLGTTKLIALIKDTSSGKIVACGALKDNGPGYRATNFEFCGCGPLRIRNCRRLGYVVVDEDHTGNHLSRTMAEMIIAAAAGPLFATTDSDRMKRTLSRQGFKQAGGAWKGGKGQLTLWLLPTE